MRKLIEFTGGGSIILGVFLSFYGAGLLNLVGIFILVIDPVIIVASRFYHLPTLKDRLENLAGLCLGVGILVLVFSVPNPGCPAYTLCIPAPNFALLSHLKIAPAAILFVAGLVASIVVADLLYVFRLKK